MLADAIKTLQSLADDARRTHTITLEHEAPDIYGLVGPDGKFERVRSEPWPRHYEAHTIDAFVRLFLHEVGTRESLRIERPGVVFCGHGMIRAVFDDVQRRDCITMKLPVSHEFKTLTSLYEQRPKLSQRKLLDLLRVDLAGASPGDFIELIRSIKFESSDDGQSEIRVGKESVSKAIKQKLITGGQIPEEILFQVPVYDLTRSETDRELVPAVISTDLTEGNFIVVPAAGALSDAQRRTDERIRCELAAGLGDRTLVVEGSDRD